MRARDLMTTEVVTVRPTTSVKEAAALLAGHGLTALPVTDATGRLVGVVSDADLLRGRIRCDARSLVHGDWPVAAAPSPRTPPPATIGEIMVRDVVVRSPGADAAELTKLMLERRLRMIPIVRNDRLVGVVTRRDLLRVVAREDADVARDVRSQLAACGGHRRWDVSVVDGVVTLRTEQPDEVDSHVADVVAASVPGVVYVRMAQPVSGSA